MEETVHPSDKFDGRVLCVGRIEPRKNQLGLLRSYLASDRNTRLEFIGALNANHKSYCREFVDLASTTPGAEYLGELTQEEVYDRFSSSSMHFSASWFEVISQVDVEALARGMRVVSAAGSDLDDYLTFPVNHSDPVRISRGDGNHFEEVVRRAASAMPPQFKAERSVTWSAVAERYLAIYEELGATR